MSDYSFKFSMLLQLNLHSYLTGTLSKAFFFSCFFFLRNSCAEKCNQLCVEQKAGVCEASCKGKELRGEEGVVAVVVGVVGRRRGLRFSHPFHPKKKKNLRINPRNRFRLKVADSKLFLFAIRQLSSNVWDDTASILFIDYQQETLSMLTMCATYKSPCCCCLFFLTSSLSQKRGEC